MRIEVTKSKCDVIEGYALNSGEYNINKLYFTFSEEYVDEYIKKALFVNKDGTPIEMVVANNECEIPYDILKTPGTYTLGVYAYEMNNDELVLRYSPEPTHFYVNNGSYMEDGISPTEPTPDEFAQYYQAMQDLIANAKPELIDYIDDNLPRINISETSTVAPGSSATVENIGTERNPIFIFGIPQGVPGTTDFNELINQPDLTVFSLITEAANKIALEINSTNFKMKAKMFDKNNKLISESNEIDLPLESFVIGGRYDSTRKYIILNSENGNEIEIPISELIEGLATKTELEEGLATKDANVIESISKNGSPLPVNNNKNVNITVPTKMSDLINDRNFITNTANDLTHYYNKTTSDTRFSLAAEAGTNFTLSIDNTTYVMTAVLKNKNGGVLSTQTIDLPLETMVVGANYDSATKEIVLILNNGVTLRVSVADLVSGLQTEITSENKISSDLVDDTNSSNKFVTSTEKTTWNNKSDFSGSFNDLTDVPPIPTQVTESTVSGWGFTKNTGTYIKPSTGIPKTDLASGIQTSLGKADTALQSISSSDVTTALGYTPYNSTNPNGYTSNTGTITGVKMNGSTIASSGVADLGTVITEHQDISGKQDKIVAGTNISIASDGKTISATDTTYSNATTTTAGLMSSDDKTKLNGIETGATKNLNYYGTCATAAATQAKVVVCDGFALEEGATISVLFTYDQDYNGTPTLNVNSTGAKNIRYKADSNAVRYAWSSGEIIDFTYNGTYWIMHRSANATTTYHGLAKYSDSLVSTSSGAGLTPKAMSIAMTNIISGTPVYSASSTYAVGDRVRYSNNVWECITAIATAEEWTAAHWQTVAPLQEQIDDKQDLLVSGTNIKTINNQSILGSGNITIEGGGSGTVDTTMSDSSTNAVQNKVIKGYVDDMVGDIGTILDNINGEVIGG